MEAAIHIKPFGFDRVFHVSGSEAPDAGIPEINEQADDLQARIDAMEEAHRAELFRARADGFEAGLGQARREREAALLSAVDAIHAAIEQVDAYLAEVTDSITRDAAEIALAAAHALAGHAIAHSPARAIDEALGRVLHQVARGTQLTVRVHPSLLPDVQRIIADRQAHDRRKLSIATLADESTPEGDALIFWDEGGLAVDMSARNATVLAELSPLLKDPEALKPYPSWVKRA
jgi:flagellar assembly protein FliH